VLVARLTLTAKIQRAKTERDFWSWPPLMRRLQTWLAHAGHYDCGGEHERRICAPGKPSIRNRNPHSRNMPHPPPAPSAGTVGDGTDAAINPAARAAVLSLMDFRQLSLLGNSAIRLN